jgi:putative hydrolase of HD superfamily
MNDVYLPKDDLESCFEFILELEKLKSIRRRTKPIGLDRYENSAEHSWQVTLLALILAKFSNEKIDVERVIKMLLVHEFGEIDANDTFFFDSAGRADAKEKEAEGVKRVLALLPSETANDFWELWNEYENGDSPEAKYARAIDRVMPMLQNIHNNRQSWDENGISKEQILSKTSYISEGSEKIWERIAEKVNQAFE